MSKLRENYSSHIVELINELEVEIEKIFEGSLKDIILYGSYARQEADKDSDIDIMVLINKGSTKLEEYEDAILELMVDLSLKYDLVVSIMIEGYKDFNNYIDVLPFFNNVESEGVRLYV